MKKQRLIARTMAAAISVLGVPQIVSAIPTITSFDGPTLATSGGPGSFGYFNGATTSNAVSFGTAGSFGLAPMTGGDGTVIALPAFAQNQAILLNPGVGANGGGAFINQYTLGFDILVPNVNADWFSFYNSNATNSNDGEAFINPANGGIGIGGDYEGQIASGQWHRVFFAVDTTHAGALKVKKYIDGKLVGTNALADGVDGRHSLYTLGHGIPTFLFADESGDTNASYVGSALFDDRAYTGAEIAALGGVHADGLTTAGASTGLKVEWRFVEGDLTPTTQVGGSATMAFFNADAQSKTTFGNTASDPAVPDFPDGPGNFIHHPQFGNGGASGYGINFVDGVDANGLGAFVNSYTIITDVLVPDLNWTPIFNTNPGHGNDADFYIAPDGAVGIGALGYSPAGTVTEGQWHRIAFLYDSDLGLVRYFVDGTQVFQGAVGPLDGRHSLYTDTNAGFDLLFGGEGDGSGNYTNEAYWGNFFFAASALTPEQIQALGGASRFGVLSSVAVPEPATLSLAAMGAGLLALRRRRDIRA